MPQLWLVGPGGAVLVPLGLIIVVLVKIHAVPPYIYPPRVPIDNSGFLPNGTGLSGAGAGFLDGITRTRHPAGIAVSIM
jgi:hypothetical protein